MSWLLLSTTEALDTTDGERVLSSMGFLSDWLTREGREIGGTNDLLSVLIRLGQGDRSVRAEVIAALASAGASLDPSHMAASLAATVLSMRDHLPELGLLFCRWDLLESADCAHVAPLLQWQRLGRVSTPSATQAVPIRFLTSGVLDSGLTLEPNPQIPAELGASGIGAVRLGLKGKVEARAQARVPIRLGGVGLSAESTGATCIDWYYARKEDPVLATSFAAAIGALANPFDLPALSQTFRAGRLLGVSIDASGEFGLRGSLSIGLTAQLGTLLNQAEAAAGVQLAFHSARRGDFRLTVRPAGAESSDPNAVRVDIRRTRGAKDTISGAVGLTFDLSGPLKQLRPALLEKTQSAKELLTQLQGFIPPSELIGDELRKRLQSQVTSPGLRAALSAALGSSRESSDLDRLGQRLRGAIDAQSGLWRRNLSELAGEIAAQAIDGLPLSDADRGLLASISQPVVETSLKGLKEGLVHELKKIDNGGGFERIKTALEKAGERLDAGESRLDALREGVTRQLDRFQGVLAKLTEALQHSGEFKLNARWRMEERRSRGRSVDQSLLFHPDQQGASELFTQTLTGSVEELFEVLAAKETDRGGTGPVTLISGTMQEFAHVHKQSGIELTLLHFKLGGQSLLDADVVIETDASGNIRVCTRAESHWSRWRPTERSDFEAINVFELASARRTRRMSLSLSLSQTHEDLREEEIREFFAGLADRRIALLARDDLSAAMARLGEAAPDAGTRRAGELRAWIELDQGALLRFLRISQPLGGLAANPFIERDRQQIYEAAIGAMIAGLQTTGSSTDYANLMHYLKSNGYGEDLAAVLNEMRSKSKRGRFKPHPGTEGALVTDQPQYDRLVRVAERALALVEVIEAMRQIYCSQPGPAWSLRDYQDRQEKIDRAIVFWVRGELIDRGWKAFLFGGDSIGPYMLGFFKVIADLSADPSGTDAGALLLASMVVPQAGLDKEVMLVDARPRPLITRTAAPPRPSRPEKPPAPRHEEPRTPKRPTDSAEQRRHDMAEFIFPLEKKINTYHTGGRRFGAGRKGGRLHGGCDLIAPKGTKILAMDDGKVIRGPYHFYSGTYALEVEHDNGKLVRYGEINKRVAKGVKAGGRVTRGKVIATVGRLRSGRSMLHLEMYENGRDPSALTVVSRKSKYKRRSDIINPKPILDAAQTLSEGQEREEPKAYQGKVANLSGTTLVNVRRDAKIARGTEPEFQLKLGDGVTVLGAKYDGGAYPFRQGNIWFEIKHGEKTGFVAAYFIETDYPVAGGTGLDGEAEVGYVSRLEGGLNVRPDPSVDNIPDTKLPLGTAVAILSQVTGGIYNSNRNDWLYVRYDQQKKGYVAAFYIDIGKKEEHGTTAEADQANMNRWEQVLVETKWSGASSTTAGQLGSGTSGGPETSLRLAEQDLERVKQAAGIFADVAAKFGVPAALLAGIASRESRCGNALDDGWGDHGNGFGIMQVDKNAHPIHGRSDPAGEDHVEQATGILVKNLETMLSSPRYDTWKDSSLLQGAAAAYNFGIDDVRTEENIDSGTTGDDYGSDVLARAKFYYQHPDLHLLRR